MTASNGSFNGNPFPLRFPPLNTSPKKPDSSFDYSIFEPIAGDDRASAMEHVSLYREIDFFSIERQFGTEYNVEPKLRRFAGTSLAARVFSESRQSGAVPGVK